MARVSNPLISVIIPVYNVEKYLDKCIQSVVNQTYENLEIILVDDGSPDNCPKICDEYAKKDKRIKVVHKENGGLSDARNAGIKYSNGEYLTFIDSDDYIVDNYVEFLYNLIIKENADISMGKHYIVYPNKTINAFTGEYFVMNSHDCLEKMLYGEDVDVSAWAKLYKRKLFDKIEFPVGRLFEDSATTYKLIDKANKVAFSSQPIYYYVIRKNSITNNKFNEKKMDLIISTKEMGNYVMNKYSDLKNACNRRVMYSYLSTLTQLVKTNEKNKKYKDEMMMYIKKNRKSVLRDRRIPKRDRVGLIATFLGFRGFKTFWRVYSKLSSRG